MYLTYNPLFDLVNAFQGRCRKIICPRDHYEVLEDCIPLYNTLTGIDINFKIKVTPQQDVQGKVANTVAKELKLKISSLLTNIVSLQSRDISVWFMPKPDGKTIHFYLFDIFVCNASKKVVYNRAVLELHDLFNTIKHSNSLQISQQTAIGLKYDIGHMLDYNGRLENLHYLMGTTLHYDYKPHDHLTISDVNWCIRIEFTADDIEILVMNVFRVKQTNTILYKDQYDIDHDADPLCLYACIDYFVDDNVMANRNVEIPNHISTTPGDANEANGKLPLQGIATAVAVLMAVILTIAVVKIRSKLRE